MEVERLLEQLAKAPQSSQQLQQGLSWSQAQVEMALRHLERAGYLSQAVPDQGVCRSGCGGCNVKNFCPTHQDQQESWRLTAKGTRRIAQ